MSSMAPVPTTPLAPQAPLAPLAPQAILLLEPAVLAALRTYGIEEGEGDVRGPEEAESESSPSDRAASTIRWAVHSHTDTLVEQLLLDYQQLLAEIRQTLPFDRSELLAIFDVTNGLFLTPPYAAQLASEVTEAILQQPQLAEKWGIDRQVLLHKLSQLTSLQGYALIDLQRRFWGICSSPQQDQFATYDALLDFIGVARDRHAS